MGCGGRRLSGRQNTIMSTSLSCWLIVNGCQFIRPFGSFVAVGAAVSSFYFLDFFLSLVHLERVRARASHPERQKERRRETDRQTDRQRDR